MAWVGWLLVDRTFLDCKLGRPGKLIMSDCSDCNSTYFFFMLVIKLVMLSFYVFYTGLTFFSTIS